MKLKQRLTATILIVMMLANYIATLTDVVVAAGVSLLNQNSQTNHANVEFNSYFEGEEHSKTFEMGKEAKLYLKLKINHTGYLKNGVVQFLNANFEVNSNNLKHDKIQSGDKDKINLKQINNGEEVIVEVPLTMVTAEKIDKDFFGKVSTVRFTGTYMDENGKEKAIEKEIKNQLNWTGTAEVELAGEVSKYLPYQVAEEKGVMVQVKVRSGLKDNQLPVETTKLEISLPEIKMLDGNTVKPERITVVANSTAATNGKGSLEFNEENYSYNEEKNKIEIQVENKEEDGKIAWNKKVADEYLVTYIYTGEEVYNKVQEQLEKANAITGEIEVEAKIVPCDNEKKEITQSGKISYSIEKAKGEFIDTTISTTSKLSKGYIYANYAKAEKEAKKQEIEEKKDTNYTVNYTAQIQDKTLISKVELQTVAEKYLDKDANEYDLKKDDVYTKTVKISEAVFQKILGEEGKVEIFDNAGNKLAEITKENYIVNIEEAKVNEIIIKTTKPITEGKLEITVEKAISAKQKYSQEEMKKFEKMMLGVITKTYNTVVEEQEGEETAEKELLVSNTTKKTNTNLTEPVSKAEISIGTKNLSTIVENKDVEIRVVLDTSSNENALYQNPTLQIVLPENIEKLNIKSSDILLDDELKIKETKVVEQNGRKVILVDLTGIQTKYMDNGMIEQSNVISKGANIVIKADMAFKKLAPSANSNIYLYYTNENTDLFEKYYQNPNLKANRTITNTTPIGMASTEIQIVAPNGVVAENHMNGYRNDANISNATDAKQTENIDAHGAAKEVTIGGAIVNNYSNSIENIAILGRIPFNGNKAVDSTEELGSNFTMAMKSKITTSGIDSSKVKVYYSTNAEANKNLLDTANNWTEEPTNLAEMKSYLIAIGGEIAQGTQFSFDYKAELPADLAHNRQSYTNYKVYYDNKMADATLAETKIAGIIGLTTGQGPELQVSVTSSSNTAREGQIVKMTATIKNIGGVVAENAKLFITAPENTIHTELNKNYYYEDSTDAEKEVSLGNIKPGETVTKNYELKVNKLEADTSERNIENIVRVSANNMTGEIKSQAYNISILDGELSIISSNDYADKIIKNANTVTCMITVQNISNEKDLDNVVITIPIPTTMKVKNAYYSYNTTDLGKEIKDNISISPNSITINLGTLKSYNKHRDEIATTDYTANIIVRLTSEGFVGSFDYIVTAKADGIEEQQSNLNTLTGKETKLSIEAQALDSKYIPENTEFTYKFIVSNIGEVTSINNKVEAIVPEGTRLEKATYTYKGETKTRTTAVKGIVALEIYSIEPGEQVEISVTARALRLPDENNKEITMWASLEAVGVSKIESNQLRATIEYDESLHPGGSSWTQTPDNNEETTSRYKITGTAWIDADKNGQRDEQEEVLAGIQVILLYKANSQVVKDETTGEEKITTTNKDGQYEFSRLKPDEYLVLFLYDAGKYSITDYQKDGVAQSLNSDATSMKIILNGEQRQAGVSNTIKITNSHVRDIDIGLFVAEKFDLRLDKYISKVTTTTPSNGTKTYHYRNSKITKREIAGKDVGNTSLVVEYKIVVTNEGQVEGYVKKIIDYLPEGAKFSSELNKDWYLSNNNEVAYNTALENEKLAPGQSKEVKLVLSFAITNKNIGKMINNNAEIYESYNELGLEDIDSIAANRVETEDDMSNADIIVSIATGSIILYTTLAFGITILLGMGVYEIKRRVLNKKDM